MSLLLLGDSARLRVIFKIRRNIFLFSFDLTGDIFSSLIIGQGESAVVDQFPWHPQGRDSEKKKEA